MKSFDNTNTGTLSRNDRQRPDSRDPEFTGHINVGGVEYWLSAWVKTAGPNAKKPGSKFFSLAIRPKDGMPDRKPVPKDVDYPTEDNWEAKADQFRDEQIPF